MKTKTKRTKRAQRKAPDSSPTIRCSFTEMRDVAALVPNPRNPNHHPPDQIELFARILKHQGIRRPVVVSKRSGFVVAGHGLLQAAIAAGIRQLPIDIQDFKNEADEWAHLVADNRLAELAELNKSELVELVKELDGKLDLILLGFNPSELSELTLGGEAPPDFPQVDGAVATDYTCPKCGFKWSGKHE